MKAVNRTGVTPRQNALYWRAFQAAVENLGIHDAKERDSYRKQVMFEEAGKRHLKDLSRTDDFDKVMARFMRDSDDYAQAAKFAVGDVYRLAVMIKICCAQIMQLRGDPVGAVTGRNYLAGILSQAKIPHGESDAGESFWMDVPKNTVRAVFQMLDTHRRRLLRPYLPEGSDGILLGFDPSVHYEPQPEGGIRLKMEPNAYREFEGIKVNVREAV